MKKSVKRYIKYDLLPTLLPVLNIITGLFLYRAWRQNLIKKRRSITEDNGIEVLEEINIGGVKQWIQIRGRDKDNPILLYLHGGPGMAIMAAAYTFQDDWEKHFTIVHWDQRGAGKSYNKKIPSSTMTLSQMNADTKEMVQYLRKRFDREKIFLLGQSWGSYLGANVIKEHPEWFYAYIGVGQIVNMWEGDKISYEFSLRMAKERGNHKALKELLYLSPYPSENMVEKMFIEREWLMFGGLNSHEKKSHVDSLIAFLSAPEYSIFDLSKYVKAMKFSLRELWSDFMKCDMKTLGYDFDIPIFLFSGRHDYIFPAELSYKYFQKIQAPHKEFVWFEDSAHSPMLEEKDKFTDELVKRVLPMADRN